MYDVRDWHAVEDVLNAASETASEPFYSQVEAAKDALCRLGGAARSAAEAEVWVVVTEVAGRCDTIYGPFYSRQDAEAAHLAIPDSWWQRLTAPERAPISQEERA